MHRVVPGNREKHHLPVLSWPATCGCRDMVSSSEVIVPLKKPSRTLGLGRYVVGMWVRCLSFKIMKAACSHYSSLIPKPHENKNHVSWAHHSSIVTSTVPGLLIFAEWEKKYLLNEKRWAKMNTWQVRWQLCKVTWRRQDGQQNSTMPYSMEQHKENKVVGRLSGSVG